jgi:hypothetical protein
MGQEQSYHEQGWVKQQVVGCILLCSTLLLIVVSFPEGMSGLVRALLG